MFQSSCRVICLLVAMAVAGGGRTGAGPVVLPQAGAGGPQKPVRVFVLAGQSNMEGHGFVRAEERHNGGKGSLEHLAKDPATADRFAHLLGPDGLWVDRDDVWVRFDERRGLLKPGFGASDERIGPELGFGWVVGDYFDEPVLLIKLAWGGKSLAVDFRPPSAGGETGEFYRAVIDGTRSALENLDTEFPELAGRGYELAGFGWHQGWNDRINDDFVEQYERNLACLIRDIRRDLNAPGLPFVVAETGMGGWEEKNARALQLMAAQAAVAEYAEFRGNVAFVGTRDFWRENEESPNQQGYHWNCNAGTYYLIGEGMGRAMVNLLAGRSGQVSAPKEAELSGYLLVPHSRVDREYNAGFSMYVAAWPLLEHYPGDRFQSGLPGTWMFAQHDTPPEGKHYSDIEGGLGWWRDTRFATTTPKFIMGGVALDFCEWANGPGAGKGRNWNNPTGLYGVVQLSPWVLWPPDGLNVRQGTCGQLFGYGYLPLPLLDPKPVTAGRDLPTGGQCWTLFLNTGNFKGPVAFFAPYFWSKPTLERPELAGQFLDTRPSDPNKAVQMETQYIPAWISSDHTGQRYARVAPAAFPRNPDGESVLLHRITAYSRAALWDQMNRWFAGDGPPPESIDVAASVTHSFRSEGGSTWRLFLPEQKDEARVPINWSDFATPVALDDLTWGYRWSPNVTADRTNRTGLPEYFRMGQDRKGREQWQAVSPAEVPAVTGLTTLDVASQPARDARPYVTPEEPDSCWKSPGPAAGPFTVELGDGSVVTWSWYRFADQPALQNADLTAEEREALQRKVELIHRHWTKERDYLPPNTVGSLADIDPALLVTPPAGMEAGYVPIVTRQAAR